MNEHAIIGKTTHDGGDMSLTPMQFAAVKYYEGDVSGSDPFWGDKKAYVTLNSLFYPGIDTERRRAAEGKRLNPAIVSDARRLFDVCMNLMCACKVADLSKPRVSYRVERYADFLEMRRAAQTISFTSTSTAGFLPAYGDRIGIALLEFRIPAGVPCLPYDEVLRDEYAKHGEQEIMLPPTLPLSFQEAPMTSQEQAILDAEGKPPMMKCSVLVGGMPSPCISDHATHIVPDNADIRGEEKQRCALDPFSYEGRAAAQRVYDALNEGSEPIYEDINLYNEWKLSFKQAVMNAAELGYPIVS